MRNWIGVGCVAFGWVVACGSSDSQSDTPKDSGSDATTDASLDAGACEPTGSWIWQSVSEGGTPKDDHVLVEAAPDAGPNQLKVTFSDRLPEQDACSIPDAGDADAALEPIAALGTLDPASCKLTVSYSQSWCYSGEQQCETWSFEVTLAGDLVHGSASRDGGWCMDKYQTDYQMSGQKQ
ncbi:MAG: hypothetical protein U0263_03020 [Polyangiaceae bacterium]